MRQKPYLGPRLRVLREGRGLTLEQCAQQDRDERAKWAEYVKIARIEPQ